MSQKHNPPDKDEGKKYYYFSPSQAQQTGYFEARLADGTLLQYTSIMESAQTYKFSDKEPKGCHHVHEVMDIRLVAPPQASSSFKKDIANITGSTDSPFMEVSDSLAKKLWEGLEDDNLPLRDRVAILLTRYREEHHKLGNGKPNSPKP